MQTKQENCGRLLKKRVLFHQVNAPNAEIVTAAIRARFKLLK